MTLREIIGDCGESFVITVSGEPVPAQFWPKLRPKGGTVVTVCPIPHGDNAKTIVLTLGLIAAAFFGGPLVAGALANSGAYLFGGSTIAAGFWTGAIYAVGALVVGALIKPPITQPEAAARQLQNLTGTSNDFRPFQPVPVVYGRHKVFPPHAALPWTEVVGDDQYLNALFAIGVGEHDLSEARIGETLLTTYQGVELTQTSTPVWPAILEDELSVELEDPSRTGSPVSTMTLTTADNIEAVSVDFMAPIGLRYTTDKAERFKGQIDFRIEYRRSGTADPWLNVVSAGFVDSTHGTNMVLGAFGAVPLTYVGPMSISPVDATCFRVEGNTSDSTRFGVKWLTGSSGQWDVRITRVHFYTDRFGGTPITAPTEFDKCQDKMIWTVLRSHDLDGTAVDTTQGVDFIQLRIKASDVVQGQLDQFSVIAERKLPMWDVLSQTFTGNVATRNPAWAFVDMLVGRSNARAITDPVQKIWLDEIAEWGQVNEDEGRKFDRVFNDATTVFDALGLCAAAGRAGRSLRDARFTIITEEQGQNPTQIFTPRNSRNFSFQQQFIDMPHALKCQFLSEQQGWQQDEVIVYDDGYDSSNAEKFETVSFDGKTDPDEIWRFGRFHLAQARLRPAQYTLDVDIEHLASVRGDLVHVEHDAVLWNLGRGRITRRVGQFITLDETFPVVSGISYRIKVRSVTSAGTIKVLDYDVLAPVGSAISTFQCVQTVDHDTAEGDLVIVGEAGHEDVALKILTVEPRPGLQATLTLVDAAPEIEDADTGTIPDYDPNITNPIHPEDVVPPTPIIIAISSGSELGVVQPNGHRLARVAIAYRIPSFQGTLYDQVEARFRQVPVSVLSTQPWVLTARQGVTTGGVAMFDVEPGETYEIQIRVVTVFGVPSLWSASETHTVDPVTLNVPLPGSIDLTTSADGIAVSLDVTTLTHRTITRVHIRLGIVDDRDDTTTVSYFFPVPPNWEQLDTVDVFIPLDGGAVDYFLWARFEDAYENVGDWLPFNPTAGLPAHYPGQATHGRLASATNGLVFVESADSSGWNADHTDLTFEWTRSGVVIATRVLRVLRTGSTLSVSLILATGEATTHTVTGSGTPAVTIFATHVGTGETVAETVVAIEASTGADGSPGAAGESYWTPVLTSGMTRLGKTFTKTGVTSAWDESVYSLELYGSCMVAFQPAQTNKFFMIGLDQNPSTSAGYLDLDYAWYCNDSGQMEIYESGVSPLGVVGNYVTGDQFAVQYDGINIRYLKNGTVFRVVHNVGKRFALDSTFWSPGAQANNVAFTPMPGGAVDLTTQIAGTLTAAFADAGLINANVTINPDGTLSAAGGGQVQVNQLPGSVTVGQLAANVVTAVQANILFLSALKADLGHITAGDITFNSTGAFIKVGTAGAGFGIGFYVDYNGGTPRLFIGDASSNYLFWDGSSLSIKGVLNFTNSVQTFTPAWSGFSSPPIGDLSFLDFGAYVILYSPQGAGGLTGTSNATSMSITNLPAAIQPSAVRSASCMVQDPTVGSLSAGGVTINGATVQFYMETVFSTHIFNSATGFASSGSGKGLAQGWLIIYPK